MAFVPGLETEVRQSAKAASKAHEPSSDLVEDQSLKPSSASWSLKEPSSDLIEAQPAPIRPHGASMSPHQTWLRLNHHSSGLMEPQ